MLEHAVIADPYPWPYDGVIVPARLAVVVAGAQWAWAERSVGTASVAATIEAVTETARVAGAIVVLVRHGAPVVRRCALPPHPTEDGFALCVPARHGDLVVDAGGVDGFAAGSLDDVLRARGITHLAMVGYGAEAAVDSTLRSANDRGYECLVLTDAVAPFSPDLGAHALSSVTMSGGIFGALAPSAAFIEALLAVSPAPTTAAVPAPPLLVSEAP